MGPKQSRCLEGHDIAGVARYKHTFSVRQQRQGRVIQLVFDGVRLCC
ncbi:MAG: hypothetical protein ACFE0J_22650 [Elainellaceae cyanobacterium]